MDEPVAWQIYSELVKNWTTTYHNKTKVDFLVEQGYKVRPLYASRGMIVTAQEGFDKLVEMLDREPQHKPRLSALLREDSVLDKQPTEAAQWALFVLSTHIGPDDSLGQKCLETIRAALTQPEFEVVDVDFFAIKIPEIFAELDLVNDFAKGWNAAMDNIRNQGYQIVRKAGAA